MTIVSIIIYNRLPNLIRWLDCWDKCDQTGAKLVIIHNYDHPKDQTLYRKACEDHKVQYIPRLNKGFDIGALKDVCESNLKKFPAFDQLVWITDDTIPMKRDFVKHFKLEQGIGIKCMEISQIRSPLHVRTTGFCISKETASKLVFSEIVTKQHCYEFEHRGGTKTMMNQVNAMGLKSVQISPLQTSPLWDTGNRAHLLRMPEHEKEFGSMEVKDHITIICPIFNTFPEIVSSMINQTHKNWTLKLIHDGPNDTRLRELIECINDPRIEYIETKVRVNNWGHSLRAQYIRELSNTDYVVITNADNHHVPVYLEYMVRAFDQNTVATYCHEMVHSYKAWCTIVCRLQRGYVDCAGVMIRAEVAKEIGWRDVVSHSSDWFFFEDIIKKYGVNRFKRVLGNLLIHN